MLFFAYVIWLFFFFKQKTAYEMRISDWSSDVCSSDLVAMEQHGRPHAHGQPLHGGDRRLAEIGDGADEGEGRLPALRAGHEVVEVVARAEGVTLPRE